jgi:large exoprotein involved in heme utilization and adhesion
MVERFSGRRPERHGGEAQQWRRSSRDEIDMMARFSSGGGAAAWRGSAAAAEKQA